MMSNGIKERTFSKERIFRLHLQILFIVSIRPLFKASMFYFRPVIGVIDVEIQKVNAKKLSKVHDDVLKSYGPSDPTIVIGTQWDYEDEEEEEIDIQELIEKLDEFGNVILFRYSKLHRLV